MKREKDTKKLEDAGVEARSSVRLKCDLDTSISVSSGDRWDCKIVDMSEQGFGIITSAKLGKGDIVNVEISGTKAKVVWIRDNRAGLTRMITAITFAEEGEFDTAKKIIKGEE